MISLCYLLSYLLNNGKLKDMDFDNEMDQVEAFKHVSKAKQGHTLGDLCYKNAECLSKFAIKVFSIKFDEKPDYEDLKQELVKAFHCKI